MSTKSNYSSKLCNRKDLIAWIEMMLPDPLKYQDETGGSYNKQIRELEYISRPLWAIFSLIASGEFEDIVVQPYIKRIKLGLQPNGKWTFPLPSTKTRQIAVEMAVYGYGLLSCGNKLLSYFNDDEVKYLEIWLNSINDIELPKGNWYFFLLIVNYGLKANGFKYRQDIIDDAWQVIETFYLGDGWYQDGYSQQRDYYIPFAFHFYSLILCKYVDEINRDLLIERSQLFAEDYKYWQDLQGRTLPFGRSLTYRFAHVSYWCAQILSGSYNYDIGIIKEIIFNNFNFWYDQNIYNHGKLTIGFGYSNLIMSEDYNAPGSPAWAFKAFILLALPSNHEFWQVEPKEHILLNKISCQKRPGFIIVSGKNHHYALSALQFSKSSMLQTMSKYGKFCYSSAFGWNVSRGSNLIENFAVDSALALSVKGTNQFISRSEIQDYHIYEKYLYSKWNYGEIADIETWLIPIDENYHVRVHRINTELELETYEGAFPVHGWNQKFKQPIINNNSLILVNERFASGIKDILGNRELKVVNQNPNTNIYSNEKNAVPCLYSVIGLEETVIGCLVYGDSKYSSLMIDKEIKFVKNIIKFDNKKIILKEY